jgi:hypothetical protein
MGMKSVDSIMTNNQKTQDGSGYEVSDSAGGGVFKDILEEKVTQEVQELRYASYEVAKQSKKYRYIGNGKVVKKTDNQLIQKHGILEESDNLPIILIQDNNLICQDVLSTLNEVNNDKNKNYFNDYNIKIKRSLFPRFLIEKYIKKLVLKQSDGNYVIDLYCSKYPSQFSEKKDKAFLSEIKRIKDGIIKNSDILDFDEIKFVTSNAWGIDDWYNFSFKEFEFYDILEFDGNYVIRFGCQSDVFMENILDKVYSETAVEKYENKSLRKNATIELTTFTNDNEYVIPKEIDLNALENIKFSIENK